MGKTTYFPKPKAVGSEHRFLLKEDKGLWEKFHKVKGKLVQCKFDDCQYCAKNIPYFERVTILAYQGQTDTVSHLKIAKKEVVEQLKVIYSERVGGFAGLKLVLRGTGTSYEIAEIEEPPDERQLNMFEVLEE